MKLIRSVIQGLMLVIVAAITLEATGLIQYYFTQKGIRKEATQRAESRLEVAKLKILDIVDQTEVAVHNSVWLAQWALSVPDSLWAVSRRMVQDNPVIVGSTIALVPGYDRKRPLFSPYCFQAPGESSIRVSSLATEEYDYPSQEWFTKPLELGEGYWSEPYVDEGGGEILMTTYSVPLKAPDGRFVAVLTADISLDWLNDLVISARTYPNAVCTLVSRSGKNMVGDTGTLPKDEENHVFSTTVDKTGWTISVIIPDKEIFGGIRQVGFLVTLLQVLGIAMIIVILFSAAKDQKKFKELNDRKERMENELRIARAIQMSMIPKIFPPFPERKDLDMSATIVPAKEVGGDLYDFYIRDEKLIFCIGDVSGKGIPASLVMAVTRSLFRTVSAHEDNPAAIVRIMNDSMAEVNESNMFVTFFIGILDLASGHLRYCNAGHNAPLILTDAKHYLPVESNLPLGVLAGFEFKEQEAVMAYDDAIFLYTDGLTEAENGAHELFGDDRMNEVLSTRRSSNAHMEAIKNAVAEFVGEAPQSDDLTMLFIHYLNGSLNQQKERHLVLHNSVDQISQLTDFLQEIADEKGLDASTAMNINLALEEAVTNVIMYAYPEGTDGLVDLEAILRDDSLVFILKDNGTPFDPTAAPEADVTLSAEERKIGGLGIFLVRKIMDTVHYVRSDGQNVLSMTKNI